MNDNISRQAAIKAINCDITVTGRDNAETVAATIGTFVDRIKALPSTDKEGFWLLDPDGMDWNLPAWICSECHCKNDNIGVVEKGMGSDPRSWAGSKFCPECGARMSGTPKIWKKRYI